METYNILNKHYEEVLDIIGEKIKRKNKLIKNRDKVLAYINESVEISADDLAEPITFLCDILPKEIFEVKNINEFNKRINQFLLYILNINGMVDGGYSLIVSYYFYISNKLLN